MHYTLDQKIIDYFLVEGVTSIQHYLKLGYQPYGDPSLSSTKVMQVMVMIEKRHSEDPKLPPAIDKPLDKTTKQLKK